MDRILELLSTETSNDFVVASKLLSREVLAASPEQSKHKLKTRISALLKSSGPTRAYGAVLARLALKDWSIVKSHGSSWAIIMLHALDLPDQVCWAPITKTLCELFKKVHGKSDLSRDISGSKIGDFMKRLVNTVQVTEDYNAVSEILTLYPTQCRPYINKLEPVLASQLNSNASYALACLCISEKQGADIWKERVAELIQTIKPTESEVAIRSRMNLLHSYLRVAPIVRVAVPASNIINKVILKLVASLKPAAVKIALDFIIDTSYLLRSAYLQKFDNILYGVSEVIDMGKTEAVAAFNVLTVLMELAGWVPESYAKVFIRATKSSIALWDNRFNSKNAAEGLADYVQHASSFTESNLSPSDGRILLDFITAVAVRATGIPQSLRIRIDKIIVNKGNSSQINLITLYPGKNSILPLSIKRKPTLEGMECLIHPRFPPLNTSKHTLEFAQRNGESDDDEPEMEVNSADVPEESNPIEEVVEQVKETTQPVPVELPSIPESTKPEHKPELSTPPEKRAKLDHKEDIEIKRPHFEVEETIVQSEPVSEININVEEQNDDDDDDDLVIPTLNMDSD